jgi:hypothetical protein
MGWGQALSGLTIPNDKAILDWTSGIIRVNAVYEEFNRIKRGNESRRSRSDKDLIEAISHETFHFLQMCTTGFLYSFALDLYESIKQCVPKDIKDPSEIDAACVPSEVRKNLNFALERLYHEGPEGLSILSIVEGAALLFQKRLHWIGISAEGFEEILDQSAPSKEYKDAYNFAAKCLGKEDAFNSYPLISNLALSDTNNPVSTFVSLCKKAAGDGIRVGNEMDPVPFVELLREIEPKAKSSAEVAGERSLKHPIYFEVIKHLNDLAGHGKFNILEYMVAPPLQLYEPTILTESLRPILFNRVKEKYWHLSIPEGLWPALRRDERRNRAQALVLLHILSSRVIGNITDPP